MSQSDVVCGGVAADFHDQVITPDHDTLTSIVSTAYSGQNGVLLSHGSCVNGVTDDNDAAAELTLVSMMGTSQGVSGVSSIVDGTEHHMDDDGIGYGSVALAELSKKDADTRAFMMPNLDDG